MGKYASMVNFARDCYMFKVPERTALEIIGKYAEAIGVGKDGGMATVKWAYSKPWDFTK